MSPNSFLPLSVRARSKKHMTNLRNSAVTTAEAAEYNSDSGTPFLESPERNTVNDVLRHNTVCKWKISTDHAIK